MSDNKTIFVDRWVVPETGGWMVTFACEDMDPEPWFETLEEALDSAKEWEQCGHGPILIEGG